MLIIKLLDKLIQSIQDCWSFLVSSIFLCMRLGSGSSSSIFSIILPSRGAALFPSDDYMPMQIEPEPFLWISKRSFSSFLRMP